MLFGTYRLLDPNGRELAALMHGNRLIKANISTADELRDLWASPKAKDKLKRRNRNLELIPSYAQNTDILNQYLQNNNEVKLKKIDLKVNELIMAKNSLGFKISFKDNFLVWDTYG